jgi:sulfur-carrier protein
VIRVALPAHLRTLAATDHEVQLEVAAPVTTAAILDALESKYPVLRCTIRDPVTLRRRPLVRFFACERDWSDVRTDAEVPAEIVSGTEPFIILGAIAGG